MFNHILQKILLNRKCDLEFMMNQFIEALSVFKHHKPISIESMQGFTISGTNGAFKELVRSSGEDHNKLTIGVGIEINQLGEILGTRLLMCGTIPEIKVNTADLFPDAETPGKAVFQKTDLGNWSMPNGRLTSLWTRREDNAVNWSIKVMANGRSKTIKFPKHGDYGFGDVVFRMNVQPMSVTQAKVSVGVAPVGGEGLEKLTHYNSRQFPVVGLENFRAKIFPQEDEGQNLGLGFQPIFILRQGNGDLDSVQYPSSMAAKEAAVLLLQSSTKPNERINAAKWREALDNEELVAEKTTLLWPAPIAENDSETTDSSASVETEGEKKPQ